MGRESDLLRMLEPVVRPGGLPNVAKPSSQPIEGQDFESLLAEATAETSAEPDTTKNNGSAVANDPLRGLTGIDRIENASLRAIVSGVPGSAPGSSKSA